MALTFCIGWKSLHSLPGLYQCFAYLWHLDRGDIAAARAVLMVPPEMLRGFDDLLRGAWLAGAVDAMKG